EHAVTARLAITNKYAAALMTRQIGGWLFEGKGSEEKKRLELIVPNSSGQFPQHPDRPPVVVCPLRCPQSGQIGGDQGVPRSCRSYWSCSQHIRHSLVSIWVLLLSH